MADDATLAYKQDRDAEAAQEAIQVDDTDTDAFLDAYLAQAGATDPAATDAAPAGPSASSEPKEFNPLEKLVLGDSGAPDPNVMQPEALDPKTMPTSEDVKRSMLRGPGAAVADFVDFSARTLDSGFEFLGVDKDTIETGTRAGDAFDKAFGKPQTPAGQAAQDITGLITPMKMVMSTVKYASKARQLAMAVLGSSIAETAFTSDKATGVANIGASQPEEHWANNWASQMLALEHDDTGFQQFVKRTTENMILNGVVETAAKGVGKTLEWLREARRSNSEIAVTAAEQGLGPADAAVSDALNEMTAVKAELDGVKAAAETMGDVPPPKVTPSVPPAEAAAAPAVPAAPVAAKLPKDLAGAKPRYGFGDKQFKPQFASDVDRAAYIAAQNTRSKKDAEYVKWGMEQTGMTEAEFRLHGAKVREAIKKQAKTAQPGDLTVEALWTPGRPKVGGEPVSEAPVVPKAATPETGAAPTPEASAAPEAAPVAPTKPADIPEPVVDGVRKKVAETTAELEDIQERFVRAIETSVDDPSRLKSNKEAAQAAGFEFTPEQTARLDAAITARVTAALPIPKDQPFGAHLTITKPQMQSFRTAMMAGDFHGATGLLGEIIGDVTNFDKIAASGDIKDLLAVLASEFSKDPKSYRLLTSRSRGDTFASAEAWLQDLAKKSNVEPNVMREQLEAALPGRDLTKTLTAYRMLEVAVADRGVNLANLAKAGGPEGKVAKAQLIQMVSLTAIINDRRAGLVSDIGRALNSLQGAVTNPNVGVMSLAAKKARMAGIDEFIKAKGGEKVIDEITEMITSAGTPEGQLAMMQKGSKMLTGTMGDSMFAFVIHNTLSGPYTHLKNLTSSAFYSNVFSLSSNMAGAVTRDLHAAATGGDAIAIQKAWRQTRAQYAALRKVLSQDAMIRRNVRQAFRTGQRVTAPGGAFLENAPGGKVTRLGEGNFARATELAKTARAGGTFQIPFGSRVPLGAALVGQKRLDKFATALDASAATKRLWSPLSSDPAKEISKRYGVAARAIDYLGRVNSWPMHALAAGDELNASIAKSGALEAEAFEAVHKLKLDPDASEAYIRDVIENIEDIPALEAKAADGALDDAGLQRLEIMQAVNDKADDYVRRMTFTEAPGEVTSVVAHARTTIPGARWGLFFVRTPGNIARAGVRESPVGNVGLAAGAVLRGDHAAAAEEAGRLMVSGAVAMSAWELITSGRMTGGGPSDPEAFALWQADGNQPYTIELPGGYRLNYGSYIDPVALPMQVLADLAESFEYMDDETAGAFADEFKGRFMKLLASKSYGASVIDAIDLFSGRANFEDASVRIAKNFIPQSRLLASLRTSGLPVPASVSQGLFGGPDGEVTTLQAFIDGSNTKGIIDRGKGVKLNDKGELVDIHGGLIDRPSVVHFVSEVAEDLPAGLADEWLEFHARVLGVRAQHGKYTQRDQLGEKRIIPMGLGPNNASGVAGNPLDVVRQELINVGMDKSVKDTFGQIYDQPLTPEQQDYFQRRYRRPEKKMPTAHEMFAAVIATPEYQTLGQTVGNVTGGRKKLLEAVHNSRMDHAKALLITKFPELQAVYNQKYITSVQMTTKEGSDAFAAERAARAPALLKAFQEGLNGND